MYNILERNKYGMRLEYVDNIEDVQDDFLTKDELRELGIGKNSTFLNSDLWCTFDAKIKRAVISWTKKIPKGKKSIKCTDSDLITVLTDQTYYGYALSDFGVTGFGRSGDRFLVKPPKKPQTEIKRTDWYKLVDLAGLALRYHAIRIRGDLVKTEPGEMVKMLQSLQKILSWSDIVKANEEMKEWYHDTSADEFKLSMIKKIWTTPTLLNRFEAK